MQQTAEDRSALALAKRLAYNAAYRAANPERVKQWNATYRARNPEKFRQSQRDYKRRRYHSDPDYRLVCQLKSRLSKAVGRGRGVTAAIAMCGCSPAELRAKLELRFTEGMSWDDRSRWHIDHIYPLGAIDARNITHVLAANNWRNLRPAWAAENRAKSASVTPEAQELFNSILAELTPESDSHAAEV
jgi:hypothetical protein